MGLRRARTAPLSPRTSSVRQAVTVDEGCFIKDGNTAEYTVVEAAEGRCREKETGRTQCSRDEGTQSGSLADGEDQGSAALSGEDAEKFQGVTQGPKLLRSHGHGCALGNPGRPGI